ncbi:SANT/Myb_domain [Hexamita inflata]|uniref:SANT/Myb domain n=1 Tax=Hexamita inflata TaxID=28002 RepID=A0AA86Q148_9EUKA|nr:SANT/Myb domain [Hexamita inflata]
MQSQISAALVSNIQLMQEIHSYAHKIQKAKYSVPIKLRWTQEETDLLEQAIQMFGHNITKIQQVLVSKTSKQIYFRMHYLNVKQQKYVQKYSFVNYD